MENPACFENRANPEKMTTDSDLVSGWSNMENLEKMDLDADGTKTTLEISAYLIRNAYLICSN